MEDESPVLYEEMPARESPDKRKKQKAELMTFLVVGAGGFVGANLRFMIGRWATQKWGTSFPYGTLIINVAGCFILGLFAPLAARLAWNDNWRLLIAVGLVGAFTTFSTFEYETFELMRHGSLLRAGANLGVSIVVGFFAVFLGTVVARFVLRGPA